MKNYHSDCEACVSAKIENEELKRLFTEAPLLIKLLPLAMQLRAKAGDLFNELGHNHGLLKFIPELRKRFSCSLLEQIDDLLHS